MCIVTHHFFTIATTEKKAMATNRTTDQLATTISTIPPGRVIDLRKLSMVADAIIAHPRGNVPDENSGAHKAAMYVGFPLFCLPCFVWSILFRCIACPCQCMWNGPWASCSDNGCTTIPDVCIGQCDERINRKVSFAEFFDMDADGYSASDINVAFQLSVKLLEQFHGRNSFDRVHYNLTDVVVRPLVNMPTIMPGSVENALINLQFFLAKKMTAA